MITDGQLLPLTKLAASLPPVRGGRPPNRTTLYRWATTGLKCRSGQRVKLDAEFVGGTLCSSIAAVQRLSRQRGERPVTDWQPPATQRDLAERQRRADAAMERMRQPISRAR